MAFFVNSYMSFLLADSGSSKTDWQFESHGLSQTCQTEGINPYYQNLHSIEVLLEAQLLPALNGHPQAVFFYGAGCGQAQQQELIRMALTKYFPGASIQVASDLLGAARSLSQQQPAMIGILGTGSNACFYDGHDIGWQPFSLGFWLGDEGSGGYLGKSLLKAYLRDELPADLSDALLNFSAISKAQIMESLYKKPFPNRYSASFAPFLYQHSSHLFIETLLVNGFSDYFQQMVGRFPTYQKYPLHLTGSVAFFFQEALYQAAQRKGIHLEKVLRSPLEGLANYHKNHPSDTNRT
jgi:glucosamine kinase